MKLVKNTSHLSFDTPIAASTRVAVRAPLLVIQSLLIGLVALFAASSDAQVCLASDATAMRNTYYAGATNPSATTVTLGAIRVDPSANTAPLAAGNLAFIIQMQDATINNSNGIAYGNGTTGTGNTSQVNSGLYEFKRVASVVGVTVTFTSALTNTYSNAAATTTVGLKRFQVIRVPEFSSLTLSTGSFSPPAWNGGTGGVFVLNVAGALTMTDFIIDASALGFRGGGGIETAVNSGNGIVDYATAIGAGTPPNSGATKGEGIAGRPRFVRNAAVTPYSISCFVDR